SFFEAVFFIAKTRARSASRDFGKPGLPPLGFIVKPFHSFFEAVFLLQKQGREVHPETSGSPVFHPKSLKRNHFIVF
ncbi:MAG: hypothetical protein Q8J97_01480, partial [Flavobacteriaceae bacterium]|nr:hypothetical protein [Flavobacteriaceae bacterium]